MKSLLHRLQSNSLFRNALAACVNQLSNFLPLILTPVLAKRLGLEAFGACAVVFSLIQLSFVITDFGYTLSTTHRLARNKTETKFINEMIGSVLLGKIPLTVISIVIALTFPWVSAEYREYWPLFALASIAIVGQSYQMTWLFQGLEQLKVVTRYMLSTKMLYLAFILLFVHSQADAYLVITGWGFAQLSAALLSLVSTYRSGFSLTRPNIRKVISEIRIAIPFFISRIAVASYTSAATVLVGVSGQQQAACFYACQQIYKVGSALPVNQVLYPYMAKHRNWRAFYIITFCSGSALSAMVLVAGIFSENLLAILLGSQISEANGTFLVFLAATIFSYFSVAFGYPALCAVDALHKANISVIYAATLNALILFALYLSNSLSALTAAFSILLTEACVLILRVIYLIHAKANYKKP